MKLTNKTKAIIYIIPIIGLIYYFICLFKNEYWFEGYILYAIYGIGVHALTISVIAILLY